MPPLPPRVVIRTMFERGAVQYVVIQPFIGIEEAEFYAEGDNFGESVGRGEEVFGEEFKGETRDYLSPPN